MLALGCEIGTQIPIPEKPANFGTTERSPVDESQRVKCRHILIQHQDAYNADPKLERTREDAYLVAHDLWSQLKNGADFSRLAKEKSDGPSSSYGGSLPPKSKGEFDLSFETSVFELEVGELSMPIETEFGWHIIERQANNEGKYVHILVSYAGTRESKSTRTRSEAEDRINMAKKDILNGMPPEDVAEKYSDGPYGSRGGMLGWISESELNPKLAEAAFSIPPGEVSLPILSPFGYHIFVRYY